MPVGINAGDTAWMLGSTALVLFMTIGLGLFYAGMVQAKNALNTFMHSFVAMALVGVLWWAFVYSLAFGPDHWHIIGGLNWAGFRGVGLTPNPNLAPTIPHTVFAMFQLMFAIITPALISGAYAERMKFSSYLVFTSLWLVLIYAPLAHMVWAPGGFLRNLGALDFAGGTVVHMNAGLAGIAAALMLGKRKHVRDGQTRSPHNLFLTLIGAGILWFGWYGFNAGSALAANATAANAFTTTTLATCAAVLGWLLVDWLKRQKATSLGAASGAVAGLVAITPACGFVGPGGAVAIGLLAGFTCAYAVGLKHIIGIDDALDTGGVHFVGGLLGALLIGVFAAKGFNPGGANGLLAGGGLAQLGIQAAAVGFTIVFSFLGSLAVLWITKLVTRGLKVPEEAETDGLDPTLHAEEAYDFTGEPAAKQPARRPRSKTAVPAAALAPAD
jgi:ammonium transporter, Amt family